MLNNAVLYTRRPATRPIAENDMRLLKAYMEGICAPLHAEAEAGYITYEEIVFILAAGALFTHLQKVIPAAEAVAAGNLPATAQSVFDPPNG